MSSVVVDDFLPPLVFYRERVERGDSWLDRLEASLGAWPNTVLPRLDQLRSRRLVKHVNALEGGLRALDDKNLRAQADALRVQLRRHGLAERAVAQSFALVRETARRQLGMRHFDVQLRGGYALLHGMVAEMNTGEGKTLAATLAVATAALAGTPVHVVTVNDYLAQRDAEAMGPLYRALGLSAGIIVHGLEPAQRRAAYACDITYASNKEIAFDYLRDRIALGNNPKNLSLKLRRLQGQRQAVERVVMRGLHFAIVDEADSVLIDEARTPLIISRETDPGDEQRLANDALQLADELKIEQDYRVLKDQRRIELTAAGRARLAELGEQRGGIWQSSIRREESARQALTAEHLFRAGDQYLVRDGKVQIIDEYTGRIMADRSWNDGLHQLIETKEGCEVTGRKMPMARLTYQRFFRRYCRLAGMTGTGREVVPEFWSVYRLPVARIPTNRPTIRKRLPVMFCRSLEEKCDAIVARTGSLSDQGRPVLIGTRSVEASETISAALTAAGLQHVVLSAAQDRDEAEVIANAGRHGQITVATNMAGRGVDIHLQEGVETLGGLHVILSERHDARRIDRQLEGRCGRQGESGSTQAILAFDDTLLELVSGKLLRRLVESGGPLRHPAAKLLFYRAQRRAERAHARARRELMKLDRKLGMLLAFSGGME